MPFLWWCRIWYSFAYGKYINAFRLPRDIALPVSPRVGETGSRKHIGNEVEKQFTSLNQKIGIQRSSLLPSFNSGILSRINVALKTLISPLLSRISSGEFRTLYSFAGNVTPPRTLILREPYSIASLITISTYICILQDFRKKVQFSCAVLRVTYQGRKTIGLWII